jgi:hypothetical protein
MQDVAQIARRPRQPIQLDDGHAIARQQRLHQLVELTAAVGRRGDQARERERLPLVVGGKTKVRRRKTSARLRSDIRIAPNVRFATQTGRRWQRHRG